MRKIGLGAGLFARQMIENNLPESMAQRVMTDTCSGDVGQDPLSFLHNSQVRESDRIDMG